MHKGGGTRAVERIADPDRWDRFVDNSTGGLPLHYLEFLTILVSGGERDLIPLGIVGDGQIEAVVPLVTERRGPGGIVRVVRNVNFYDGLVPQVKTADLLLHLGLVREEARRKGIALISFAVFPDRPMERSLLRELGRQGYEVERQSSFVIPLKGRDTSSIRKFANRRIYRNMEHAKEYGVQVRDATEPEMQEIFPRLERVAYEATGGIFPFSPSVFGNIWRRYHGDPRFSMRTAYTGQESSDEQTVLGMGLIVDNGRMANFWKLATRKDFDYMQPSTVLYWDAIERAAAKGLEAIDTGSAPSRGIAEYKAQWGSLDTPYYRIRSMTGPVYDKMDKARRACAKIFKGRQA